MAAPISRLLGQTAFQWPDCLQALRGKALPQNLGNQITRQCLVSGLRKHPSLARSAEVDELCRFEGQDIFARARNASLIQNDQIPDQDLLRDTLWHPYCIWYPRIASEDTYRRLVAVAPEMRYQVGRACAVGGYWKLYNELDLLPDPTIAEEARENRNGPVVEEGAQRIYKQIMAAPTRYGVLNDYKRTVELDMPLPGACLNADTAIFTTLKRRWKPTIWDEDSYPQGKCFNITEDGGVGEKDQSSGVSLTLTENEAGLLDSPLPFDLPTMRKNLLILVAAYDGNLDRYARLRRPGSAIFGELCCVLAGVEKSTALANWLDRNPDIVEVLQTQQVLGPPGPLKRAIHARRVMNNDVRYIRDADPPIPENELPYHIWKPTMPSDWTLETLAEAIPAMRPQCARACIAGYKQRSYLKIMNMRDEHGNPVPIDECLLIEARHAAQYGWSDFYLKDLEHRIEVENMEVRSLEEDEEWKRGSPSSDSEKSCMNPVSKLHDSYHTIKYALEWSNWDTPDTYAPNMGTLRLFLSTPPDKRGHMDEKKYERVVQTLKEISQHRLDGKYRTQKSKDV